MYSLKDVTELNLNGKYITEMILETDEVTEVIRIIQPVLRDMDPLSPTPDGFIPGEYILANDHPNLTDDLYSRARSWFGGWRLRAHEAVNRNYDEIHLVIIPL